VTRAAPNLLLVMADQLAASCLPFHGHPVVRAPNLTGLAREGVTFDSAYSASPLCAPSRCAMLAGRRPSQIEVFDNAAELPASVPTVTHALRAAGYATTLVGKMHFVGPDQLHGFEERLTTDVYPADFDWTPDWTLAAGGRASWHHNMSSVLEAGVHEAALQTDYDDEVCFRAVQKIRHLAAAGDGRPFFLVVSFTNPHDPWEVRRRHWDLYDDAVVDLPKVGPIPYDQADPHSRRLRDMYGSDDRPLTEAEVRRARHGYYAAVSYMDERVGEVLEALDTTGLAGDTAVLFTADHGEMLGERGLWYKMSFFEGSARVPLVVRLPGVAPRRISHSVSHLDLAPTLLDLAGVTERPELEGSSLVPLLTGGAAPGAVVAEYLAEGVGAPAVMIRRGRHKFIRCAGDPDQLYDLEADPDELVNLAGEPAHVELMDALGAESERRWDLADVERRVLDSQKRRRLVARALAVGPYTPWDFQPYVDASTQFTRGESAANPRPGRAHPFGGALTNPHADRPRSER
jgi:choline-sulfatase